MIKTLFNIKDNILAWMARLFSSILNNYEQQARKQLKAHGAKFDKNGAFIGKTPSIWFDS